MFAVNIFYFYNEHNKVIIDKMSNEVSNKKKVKLFNKKLNEFTTEYNNFYKKNFILKVNSLDDISVLYNDIQENKQNFIECQDESLSKIKLFSGIIVTNIMVWEYLHMLYLLSFKILDKTIDDNLKNVLECSRKKKGESDIVANNIKGITKDSVNMIPNININSEKLSKCVNAVVSELTRSPDLINSISSSIIDRNSGQLNPFGILSMMQDPDNENFRKITNIVKKFDLEEIFSNEEEIEKIK